MPRINLLPWREELRKERLKNFVGAAVGAFLMGAVMVLGAHYTMSGMIDYQERRNQLLKTEIEKLEQQIKEITNLENQKERLLARMEIIEQLQRSRPEIVHLFEELVTTLPEGVFLKQIKQNGKRLEMNGAAQSSTRVSAYMRNIDASDWLTDPGLEVVKTLDRERGRDSEFTLFAQQVSLVDTEEGQ